MIFIVGNSRSGTTMLGRMLGNNSKVNLFPELHLFGPCIAHGKELEKISKNDCIKISNLFLITNKIIYIYIYIMSDFYEIKAKKYKYKYLKLKQE